MLECLNIWNQMECFGKAFKEDFNQEEDETKRVERMTERTQKDFGNLLHTFIEHELGNLPLAVSLWGRILNPFLTDGKKEEVEKIMKQLKSNLDGMDEQGKGSVSQRITTMKQSVKIAVERLMTRRDGDGKEADEEREKAFQLMVSLALLHPTQTPLSFFQDDGYLVEEGADRMGLPFLYQDDEYVRNAQCLLIESGLMRPSPVDPLNPRQQKVGIIHQVVHKCLKDLYVKQDVIKWRRKEPGEEESGEEEGKEKGRDEKEGVFRLVETKMKRLYLACHLLCMRMPWSCFLALLERFLCDTTHGDTIN